MKRKAEDSISIEALFEAIAKNKRMVVGQLIDRNPELINEHFRCNSPLSWALSKKDM